MSGSKWKLRCNRVAGGSCNAIAWFDMNEVWVGPDGVLPLPWLGATLRQAVAQQGHALLLHGGEGRGLLPLAMSLAQATLCSHDDAGARPCGRCDDCHYVQTHVHPDLHVLVPDALRLELEWPETAEFEGRERTSKPSKEIRIEGMRTAIDWGTRSVARARAKVMVVHPASSMNGITANSLLKTLEEPAGKLKLILTAAHRGDLLPTLVSRCQHVMLPLPLRDVALAWLTRQGVADADVMLNAAGGEPVAAQAMAAQGVDASLWRQLPERVRRGDAAALAGWSVAAAVDALGKLCHDAMCVAAGAPTRYFDAANVPSGAHWTSLRQWSLELARIARHADHPWQAPLAIDALVIQAARAWGATGPQLARMVTLASR